MAFTEEIKTELCKKFKKFSIEFDEKLGLGKSNDEIKREIKENNNSIELKFENIEAKLEDKFDQLHNDWQDKVKEVRTEVDKVKQEIEKQIERVQENVEDRIAEQSEEIMVLTDRVRSVNAETDTLQEQVNRVETGANKRFDELTEQLDLATTTSNSTREVLSNEIRTQAEKKKGLHNKITMNEGALKKYSADCMEEVVNKKVEQIKKQWYTECGGTNIVMGSDDNILIEFWNNGREVHP